MKKLIAITLISVLMGLVAGCGSGGAGAGTGSTLEKAQQQGYVTVGFANEKPYAYQTPDGKITGEAVEVARAVLKKMGINEMRGVLTEFGSLIPGLKAKRFDIITAGMFITPQRAKEVAFANPEYSIGEALAVQTGNPYGLHSYKDIATKPNVKVAIMTGAIEYDYMIKSGITKEQVIFVPDQPSAIAALKSGRVHAITMTGPSLNAMLETAQEPSIERVKDFEQPVIDGKSVKGYGATAFRIEDREFREGFNRELKKMQESGELLEILRPFGFTEQELPGDVTAEELSKP